MTKTGAGLVAGFAATVVLSAIMVVKTMMGVLPEMNAIKMLAGMAAQMSGTEPVMMVGWLLHFVIGTVFWGGLFALTNGIWPGNQVVKGIAFSVVAWIAMMLVVMPMAGKGVAGLDIGIMAPVATLMLHIIFGAVLGGVYGKLADSDPVPARA